MEWWLSSSFKKSDGATQSSIGATTKAYWPSKPSTFRKLGWRMSYFQTKHISHRWLFQQAKLLHLGHEKFKCHPRKAYWRVTICGEFWSNGIIGIFLFENDKGDIVPVNGEHYHSMQINWYFAEIVAEDIHNIRFQENGASYHTAHAKINILLPILINGKKTKN